MQAAILQFTNNLESVKELQALYDHLTGTLRLTNDLSDILRAEIVYSVSALDRLVHELVRIGMIQSFNGLRSQTGTFKSFPISANTMLAIKQASTSLPSEYYFEQEIILRHKSLSFQEPDKIAVGLSLIWEEQYKWQKISLPFSKPEKDVKNDLKNIVNRRNQIVHEADMDLQTGLKRTISASDAVSTISFIEMLGNSIFNCVK